MPSNLMAAYFKDVQGRAMDIDLRLMTGKMKPRTHVQRLGRCLGSRGHLDAGGAALVSVLT